VTSGSPDPQPWQGRSVALARAGGWVGLWAVAAAAFGATAAVYYARVGLTLSHYDAKAHLVVARRILDSLTPGWEQIGAVWLPLPHLLNVLPVQIDFLYRTGAFAVTISVLSNATATASIAALVRALTGSRWGAALAALLYLTNPNVLYLQSTPMTEPLLFGLSCLQVWLFTRWVLEGQLRVPVAACWVSICACLTRYEAWPITAVCLAAATYAWWRRGNSLARVLPVMARTTLYPTAAIIGFAVFSRITVGEWFVSGGFFVPDATLQGQPAAVAEKIAEGTELLGGIWLVRFGALSAIVAAALGLASAGRAPMLIALSLFAAAALPISAYLAGHPFRMRYEVPIVVAACVSIGMGTGLFRRLAPLVAIVVLALVWRDARPFDARAPIVLEAQLDRNVGERQLVAECLRRSYDGTTVMASMGALGHYMHELSAAGFSIRDFLHEGNGVLWDSAFTRGPAPLVGWVLVEDQAEGGDAVIQRQRLHPRLLRDFEAVCSGGDVTLYRRK
jgi:hypothetical protein